MSTEPEYAVIGTAIVDPKTIPNVLRSLRPEDFSDDFGRSCYELLQSDPVREKGEVVCFSEQLKQKGIVNAESLLAESFQRAIPSKIEEYCRLVRAGAQKRKLVEIAMESNVRPIQDIQSELREVFEDSDRDPAVKDREEAIGEWVNHFIETSKDPGKNLCPTGYRKLDGCLGGGLIKGGLYIVGARPGMGKTTFALNMANRISNRDAPVLFISLEMSSVQITAKSIAIETGLDYTGLLNATATSAQYDIAADQGNEMAKKPFYLMDGYSVTVAEIESIAREYPDLKCLFIDYLGLIAPADGKTGIYEQVTANSRALKQMAKRLSIPVVCLCQLNRNSMQQADKRPKLSDLRDSGAIEQDADAVLLLYRDDYFGEAGGWPTGILEVNVAKNRHGESGKIIDMTWHGRSGTVIEME